MKPCSSCGTKNEDSAMFCDNCGANLGGGVMPGGAPPMPPAQPAYPPATPAGGGVTCPSCGQSNMAGTMFCDNCGAALSGVAPAPAYPQPGVPPAAPVYTPPPAQPVPGFQQPGVPPAPGFPPAAQPFPAAPAVGAPPPMPCRLMIGGQQITVPQKAEAIVGRADLASGWNPDVDLTPFGGTPEAGVSRKHAKIVWQGAWMVEDMNSVNGTYLRGQRLVPSQRMPVSNGETIQVGKLQITFFAQ